MGSEHRASFWRREEGISGMCDRLRERSECQLQRLHFGAQHCHVSRNTIFLVGVISNSRLRSNIEQNRKCSFVATFWTSSSRYHTVFPHSLRTTFSFSYSIIGLKKMIPAAQLCFGQQVDRKFDESGTFIQSTLNLFLTHFHHHKLDQSQKNYG